jgi:hypothetical protein
MVSSTDARGRADATEPGGRAGAVVVLIGFAASVAALAVAPAVTPPDYSWVSQTTSESAAQGVQGAWVARLGFVLFGLSVIFLAFICRRRWGPWAASLHGTFGALMIAAAAFSHRPWMPGANFDRTEDLLHSVAASGMGVAFALGVVAAALGRNRGHPRWRVLDVVAVAASVAIPLGMSARPGLDGAIQRLMFVVAYVWYAVEAVSTIRERAPATVGVQPR